MKRPDSGFIALQTSLVKISNISQWKQLPVGVHSLSITECDSVETLIEEEPLQSKTCVLKDLQITNCCLSRSLRRVGLPTNALESLEISHCSKLEFLLPVLLRCHHPFLKYILIGDSTCDFLSLSFSLSFFPRLNQFEIYNLEGLEFLSILSSVGDPTSLNYLDIQECPDIVYIELPALNWATYVISRCLKLKLLKHTLSTLESLNLRGCLELLFQRDGLPSNLRELLISSCNLLTSQVDWVCKDWPLLQCSQSKVDAKTWNHSPMSAYCPPQLPLSELNDFQTSGLWTEGASTTYLPLRLRHRQMPWVPILWRRGASTSTSLTTLSISNCSKLRSLGEEGLQHLTSLKSLSISGCHELESLTEAGLQRLISLENLQISDCPKLQYLTKERLPNSLSHLSVDKCSLLERCCQFGKGQDWQHIAHIPHIIINDELYWWRWKFIIVNQLLVPYSK